MSTIILEQIEPEILTTGEDLQPPEITPEPHEAEIVEQEFVPVTGLSGSVLFKQHSGNLHDILDCSGKMLRLLDFSVRNSHNQLVDLHGGSLSFELVFAPMPN